MEQKKHWMDSKKGTLSRLLQWINLRPEESDRTWLMFSFYTTTCIGLRWSEDSAVALFLDGYGAKSLPLIYIASAVTGVVLVVLYSWLQKIFPLRWVIVAIAPCMFVPLVLLSWGMYVPHLAVMAIFLLRLWIGAFYVVNELNVSITANHLFNIREIKRAYPLVSSGILVADIIGGFTLPFLLLFVGLDRVIMPVSGAFIALGAVVLWHLTNKYQQVFPQIPQPPVPQVQHVPRRRLSNPSLKSYVLLLFVFFALLEVLRILIDFQYLTQLQKNYSDKDIASFLGLFGGILGVCELAIQLFTSSRLLERFGVFLTVATLPACVSIFIPFAISLLYLFPTSQWEYLLWSQVILKFLDELLRYTFVASGGPLLFQPIPDQIRSFIQTLSAGVSDAFGAGLAGLVILVTLQFSLWLAPVPLLTVTAILGFICTAIVWVLQTRYVSLLVLSAGRGELNPTNVDLRAFKQAIVKALREKGNQTDKLSCIELLSQIDPKGAAEVLAPLLMELPPSLQQQSLEVMLTRGVNPTYLPEVRALLAQRQTQPAVFALVLRYIWLCEKNPDNSQLEIYLKTSQNSLIRATAAALLLRWGTPMQSSEATHILRRMLTHKQEQERINAVKALSEGVYLQALRLHIPDLLQDESLRVRCAVLELIGASHLEEYYSALLKGLYYRSTRMTAMGVLAQLENEALPMLTKLATNLHKPEVVRICAWRTIGQMSTLEAIDTLWLYLEISRGATRNHILRILLKKHQQEGIANFVDRLRSRVEKLIEQELCGLGEIYAAYIDLKTKKGVKKHESTERFDIFYQLLECAILDLEIDRKEVCLLLLWLLYPQENIQAAAFNLRSKSGVNLARGLEILEHTVDLPIKSVLLNVLDKRSPQEKLQKLVEKGMVTYQPMTVSDRIRNLVAQKDLLSDWCLACCFHFAQIAHIRLASEEILASLCNPTGFVREAAIAYLSEVSPTVLRKLLPKLQNDPHPLVANQVRKLMYANKH